MKITMPFQLSDAELVSAMTSFAGRERQATAHLIAHLAEFDRRRLHLAAGFPSLFMYCVRVLQLSEPEAYNRIEAARVARRFPVIVDKLAEGSLSMTTVRLLASHLTLDNHEGLLADACGKTKREVDELLARHFPQPDVASCVRKLPAPKPMASPVTAATSAVAPGEPLASPPPLGLAIQAAPPTAPPRPAVVKPLAPERYEVRFTADAETCEQLRLAQDMLRHAVPTGDMAQIIKRALTVLLEQLAKEEVRQDRAAAGQPWRSPRLQVQRGEGQARGLDPGPGALCVRRQERASLQRARLRRVPSPGSVWSGRRGHSRHDGASLSRPQQLRGRAVLRPPSANSFRNECVTAADRGDGRTVVHQPTHHQPVWRRGSA